MTSLVQFIHPTGFFLSASTSTQRHWSQSLLSFGKGWINLDEVASLLQGYVQRDKVVWQCETQGSLWSPMCHIFMGMQAGDGTSHSVSTQCCGVVALTRRVSALFCWKEQGCP